MNTDYRHIFKLWSGEVIIVPMMSAKRVLDRRADWEQPQTVWEVLTDKGVVRRLWPDDIREWDAEIR